MNDLHRYIIENNHEALSSLHTLNKQRNPLGLTGEELAKFLGREWIQKKFYPVDPPKLLLQTPQCAKTHPISEAEFEEFFHISYLRWPRASDYSDLQKVFKEFPISYRMPFITKENRTLYETYKSELDRAYRAPLSIRWISAHKGYGLFAEAPLLKESFVAEYTGYYRPYRRFRGQKNSYCLQIPTRFFSASIWMIDAWRGGNETRFANHSETPNMELKCLIHGQFMRVVLFTKSGISQGDELTFDYGKDYWMLRKTETSSIL